MSKKSKKAEEVLDTLKEKLEEKGQEITENQEDLEIVEEDLSPEELMEKENTDLKQQVGESARTDEYSSTRHNDSFITCFRRF